MMVVLKISRKLINLSIFKPSLFDPNILILFVISEVALTITLVCINYAEFQTKVGFR